MEAELVSAGLVILAYLIGSIPPAYIVGKLFFGTDIRNEGSGNVGGANAGRLFGNKVLVFVGLFDILKGTTVILLTKEVYDGYAAETGFFARTDNIIAVAAFFVVLGHSYSIFLKFSGGKGGATVMGITLGIDPFSALILAVFWLLIVYSTRFTSLGNLLGVISLPLLFRWRLDESAYELSGLALIFLIFIRHQANLGRLFDGSERKFGSKEKINN